MRFAVDTGGTFTDLVLDTGHELRMFKALTTPSDPVRGCSTSSRSPRARWIGH
jgi:N-methylhydantoinase A